MNDKTNKPDTASETLDEKMITIALTGKLQAIGSYDDILWKIRSGYVVILYGALTLILGSDGIPNIPTIITNPEFSTPILILTIGFSLSISIIDYGYLVKKLKVVISRDMLVEHLLTASEEISHLPLLLSVSGESNLQHYPNKYRTLFHSKLRWNWWRIIVPLYATTPLIVILIAIIA